MKEALSWLLIAIALFIVGGTIYRTYQVAQPCTHTIAYSIGAVDPRFGVSSTTVVAEAEAAALVWNKASGKKLLAYNPKGPLTISFVYDEREAAAHLGINLANKDAQLDSERQRLDVLHKALVRDEAAYNQRVAAANARGGARGSEYQELQAEQASLNTRAGELNLEAKEFNKKVADFNEAAQTYNQTAGHTFEEGHYVVDARGARIEIYEFIGAEQLERVLAHELGHAIGLDHNNDETSIMYAKNESGKLTPSATDVSDLKKLCGIT